MINQAQITKIEITKAYTVLDTHDYYTREIVGYRFNLLNAEALRHHRTENSCHSCRKYPNYFFRVWDNEFTYYEIEEIEIV